MGSMLVRMMLMWLVMCMAPQWLHAQPARIKAALTPYFKNYSNPNYTSKDKIAITDVKVDEANRWVGVYVNEGFVSQPFTPALTEQIYTDVRALLPSAYQSWTLTIHALGKPIERLVPISLALDHDSLRYYARKNLHKGNPWVTPMSLPYKVTQGLQGRHLCIWASHGRYFSHKKQEWIWQRPNLFCTNEDLFTQTIVVPYLMPMLERAGAVVVSPRERDWNRFECIVDNDTPQNDGTYTEAVGRYGWQDAGMGFAHLRQWYFDGQNPFEEGTARMAETQSGKRDLSSILWTPSLPQAGMYAVYVSYKTLPASVSDALYTVRHRGVNTLFRVNQQMGGGTWVYLGTFDFAADNPYDNCVMLTNQSNYRGLVTGDAVRFGGGMGNVARMGGRMQQAVGSGLPRFLEAARYYAQWAGAPYQVYSPFEGTDDYSDDIRCRPWMVNYLARGSEYLPGDSGLCVPIELSMGLHSDAGFRDGREHIGTLGIYTTDWNEGFTAVGLDRLTSRDLADVVMSNIYTDLTRTFGQWTRRQMYDRNYGESREPMVPGMILEMLSHQNWWDLYRGHDPYFKFMLARSIYKGILRYLSLVHEVDKYAVAPLPVREVSAHVDPINSTVTLEWLPTYDPDDPSSDPEDYIVYRKVGQEGYDNGTLVRGKTSVRIDLLPEQLHQFRVTAVNAGGESMPSTEVCALCMGNDAPRLLIVDGFQRVAGPRPVETPTQQGFDMLADPGVTDVRMPGYCGIQTVFDKQYLGRSLGQSGQEMEGMIVAGNTHDYSTRHAMDICQMMRCNIGSATVGAVDRVPITQYQLMDIVMGAQRDDGYSALRYKTFTPALMQTIQHFTISGGCVMVSGSYIASDMLTAEERQFTADVFKYENGGCQPNDSLTLVSGMNTQVNVYRLPCEAHYSVPSMDVLVPVGNAFPSMAYRPSGLPAAVAYPGQDYRCMAWGFPLECITDDQTRRSILYASLQFLLGR